MADQAEIHRMAWSKDVEERKKAAEELRNSFDIINDKEQAWDDLHRLTQDKNDDVRSRAADSLGTCYSHLPDEYKKQAWDDLIRLTQDKNKDLRVAANHSSGRVSIYRASQAEGDESVRKELEIALSFFEKSSNEATYDNPAKFCLPFYRSFYTLTFKKEDADVELKKYISDAKSAVQGSESKEKLLEAVENLGNALKEAHKARDFSDVKGDLNSYRRYCDRALELLDTTEEKTPGASRLIKKGLPIIYERIKEILGEIESNTKSVCKQTKGTEFETIGKEIHNAAQKLIGVRDPIGLEKSADLMVITLSDICKKLPEDQRDFACELLRKAHEEQYIEDKLSVINNILSKIITHINSASEFQKKAEQYENEAKSESGEKKVSLIKLASETYFRSSDLYKQRGFLLDSYLMMAKSKSILVSIETEDTQALNDLEEAIIQIDKAIKITDNKDIKQTRRLQGLRFEYLARKYIWFAIISKDNTSNQDIILFKIVDCFMNASKIFEQDGNKEYGYKCKGCAYLYESLSHLSKGIKNRKKEDFWESLKSFKKAKKYYSAAKSIIGVNIIDKIGDLIDLLKEFIDNHSECIDNRKNQRIRDFDKIFNKILDIIEEISAPGLKKLFTKYLCDETMANVDSIEKQLSMIKKPKKEKAMTTIKINNSKSVQVGVGKDITQVQDSIPPKKKAPKKQNTTTKQINQKEPGKSNKNPKQPIPYLSELESEIADIFKSIYQKDRKPGISEVNAKTLESLKHKLHDLKASGNDINWLDMGCGDGRCLEVLEDIQNRGNIYYHGIDISHKFLDDAQIRAKKYGIKSKVETMSTSDMKFDSEFDLVSAVLFLHEVDPICLPYVIRNMLRALKSDGTLVISDFEGPYEQEEAVVSWGAEYLKKFLSNIGGARMSPGFVPSGEFPKELGFYRCYVKKPELDDERFEKFIDGYGGFMKEKKEDSHKRREVLRSQINKKVSEILKHPDIDRKNISDEEKALLRESMGKEYGIKALKIRLLTNEILFLDKRISEFEKGERCGSV